MKRPIIFMLVGAVILAGAWFWWHAATRAPSDADSVATLTDVLPADHPFPAAGVCADISEDGIARFEINSDIPSPRCLKVTAGDRLVVKNNTGGALSMWFGSEKKISFAVEPRGEYQLL